MSYYQRFGAFYARSFNNHPWITLAVANSGLGVLSDSLAQNFERYDAKRKAGGGTDNGRLLETDSKDTHLLRQSEPSSSSSWDFARSSRFFIFGVTMAPGLAEWNRFIEYRFPLRTAATATGFSAVASTGAQVAAKGGMAAAGSTAANLGKVSLLALGKRVAFDQIAFAPFGLACFVGIMGGLEHGSWQGIKNKFSDMYTPALIANWQIWPMIQLVNFRFVPLRLRVPFTSFCGIAWTLYLSLLQASSGKLGQAEGEAKNASDRREVPGSVI